MNYALIENGKVINVIWLADKNANDFPNAVKLNDRPVAIGDTYDGEKFYRDGVEVLTETERLQAELAEANATAESLAERVVDLEIALLEVSV